MKTIQKILFQNSIFIMMKILITLFLDMNLKVRRFTPQMREIVKLIPGDVGRPITDLFIKLIYPALADDARVAFPGSVVPMPFMFSVALEQLGTPLTDTV